MTFAAIPDGLETAAREVLSIERGAERVETDAGGTRIVWRVWGSGPDLLMIHGGEGSWMHFVRNVEAIARQYRVIVPDLPGYGESASPPPPHTADRLAELLEASQGAVLRGPNVDIVGFSMGGSVALNLADRLGDRVGKLLVVGCGRGFGLPSQELPGLVRWRKIADPVGRTDAHRANLESLMLSGGAAGDPVAVYIHGWSAEHTRIRYERGAPPDARTLMSRLRCEVHGIWGDEDVLIGPYRRERIEFLREYRPDSETVFIPDGGHWIQYEQPELFNACVLELLGRRKGA